MGKQNQGVREETIWMSVNWWTGENGSLEGDKSDGLNVGNQGECEEWWTDRGMERKTKKQKTRLDKREEKKSQINPAAPFILCING